MGKNKKTIKLKITAWYLRDRTLDGLGVECHNVPYTWGLYKHSGNLEEIASSVAYETVIKHRVNNPRYEFELHKGPFPLEKVKKYPDYEKFTREPPQYVVRDFHKLLREKTEYLIMREEFN